MTYLIPRGGQTQKKKLKIKKKLENMVKTILPLLLATSAMGMPMGDELAAPKPAKPDFNPAEHIRKWLRDGKIIAVNSLDDDSMPVSSLEFSFSSDRQCDGFQFENKGNPIILLSKSGLTYKNWVNHDGDVTLTADKFGHGRVLLYGSLRDLDLSAGDNTEEALQRCFVAAHPEAEGIFDGEGAEDLVWLEFDVHLNCAGTVNGVTYDEDIDRENFHGDFDLGPEDSDGEDEEHHGKHHGKKHHGKKHHGKKHHGKKHHGDHHGDHHDGPHHEDHHGDHDGPTR